MRQRYGQMEDRVSKVGTLKPVFLPARERNEREKYIEGDEEREIER